MRLMEATPAMAGLLAGIHADAFPPHQAWDASFIARILDLPGNMGLLAETAEGPGGFILYSLAADEGEILTVAVSPRLRRRGIGRRLLSGALAELGMHGARRVFLDVDAENRAAVALYEQAGFSRVGLRKGYYGQPGGARRDALMLAYVFGEGCGCEGT